MKNKKLILLLIVLFPSTFWLLLELSTVNSKKLPVYGPKTFNGKDTEYYKVNDSFYSLPNFASGKSGLQAFQIDTVNYPLFVLLPMNEKYKQESYRIQGLIEYAKYKPSAIKDIPIIALGVCNSNTSADSSETTCPRYEYLFDLKTNKNIYNLYWPRSGFDSLVSTYYTVIPYSIDKNFLVLIDKNRRIRGYYDGRMVAEVKRLIEEYKHLRLKEEQKILLKNNKIESK